MPAAKKTTKAPAKAAAKAPAKSAAKAPAKPKAAPKGRKAGAAAEPEVASPVVAATAPVADVPVAPARLTPLPHTEALRLYEPGRPLEEVARELGLRDADRLVKLASNENPLGPSPKAIMAMQLATSRMHLYPDGGCFYLRQKLAKRLGVEPGQLIFGAGSNEIIEFIGHAFLDHGVNMIMSERAFVVYKLVGQAMRAEVREVPMQGFTHDLEAMVARIDANTRAFFIANPNNPTGTVVGLDAIRACLAKVPPHVLVVLDEAYIELIPEDEAPDTVGLLRDFPNLILLRTFSKAFGLAGLRIGYGIARPEVVGWLEKFRQPFNVPAMSQVAAIAALDDKEHLYRTRYNNSAGIDYFESRFKVMKLEFVPSYANFILVKTGRGREIFHALLRKGIIVRPMDAYGMPDHIRISIGTPEQNRACIEALLSILNPQPLAPVTLTPAAPRA